MAAADRHGSTPAKGPPPLRPFGLVLHHDGSWTHEGIPLTNRRLRRAFDRSVRFLPGEGDGGDEDEGEGGVYVVQLGRFRGQIEVEEAAFFVREFDAETATVGLSDGSRERFLPDSLGVSERDGALLCRVKPGLRAGGLPARFTQAAQAELLLAVEDTSQGPRLRLGGALHAIPEI